MRDFAKENLIDQRLVRLEHDVAFTAGRQDALLKTVSALIESHPNREQFLAALKPMVQGLQFPTVVQRDGFDQTLMQVRQALSLHPDAPTS